MIPPMQVNKSVSSLDNFRSKTPALNTRRYRAMRCLICSVFILATAALAACGAVVVREYIISGAYSPSNCHVVDVVYAEDAVCTFCEGWVDKGRSKSATHACNVVPYPCARVLVNFVDDTGRRIGHGMLYDDTMQASGDDAEVRD